MTNAEIMRMAQEAGLIMYDYSHPSLQRFAAMVAAAEREACAEICDHEMDQAINDQMMIAAGNCADKIRARGD